MGPRLVDPEVETTFRERSKGEREALSDTLSRVGPGSAARYCSGCARPRGESPGVGRGRRLRG